MFPKCTAVPPAVTVRNAAAAAGLLPGAGEAIFGCELLGSDFCFGQCGRQAWSLQSCCCSIFGWHADAAALALWCEGSIAGEGDLVYANQSASVATGLLTEQLCMSRVSCFLVT